MALSEHLQLDWELMLEKTEKSNKTEHGQLQSDINATGIPIDAIKANQLSTEKGY